MTTMGFVVQFAEKHKLQFRDINLLAVALGLDRQDLPDYTGPSCNNLAWLGDAILLMLVREYIITGPIKAYQADLMLTNDVFARLAINSGMSETIPKESALPYPQIKYLATRFEATVGACYLDQGLDGAMMFLRDIFLRRLPRIVKQELEDPIRRVQIMVQQQTGKMPARRFERTAKRISCTITTKQLTVRGYGADERAALRSASKKLLPLLIGKESFS